MARTRTRPCWALWALWALVMGLPACIDQNLIGNKDDGDVPLTESEVEQSDTGGDTEVDPPEEEVCDGFDNDDDGHIDEGFPDEDADGLADCVDEACVIDEALAEDIEHDTGCSPPYTDTGDPWDIVVEQHHEVTSPSGLSIRPVSMPVIAPLFDTDGDGLVTDDDKTYAIFANEVPDTKPGVIALDLATGEEALVVTGPSSYATVLVIDADRDGAPEIYAHKFNEDYPLGEWATYVSAYDNTGEELWSQEGYAGAVYIPGVGDMDGDGDPEITLGTDLMQSSNGSTLLVADDLYGGSLYYTHGVIADYDLDGEQEWFIGYTVRDLTGTDEVWLPEVTPCTASYCRLERFNAFANLDDDDEAELINVEAGYLRVVDHDGTKLWTHDGTAADGPICPPTVADIDGDDDPDIVVNQEHETLAFDGRTGARLWTANRTTLTSPRCPGIAGYDFLGDGSYELITHTDEKLYILDGATGSVLWSTTDFSSNTGVEYPVVADVDQDGSAEIVYQSTGRGFYGDWTGITVLGHARDAWAASGPTWRAYDFIPGTIEADGIIPTTPPTPWLEHNLVRARPVVDDPPGAELRLRLDDVCVASCLDGGNASLAVSVLNSGAREARAETPIALYALDGVLETLIAVDTLGAELPAGESSGSIVFDITIEDRGSDGFLLRVDDDGTGAQDGIVRECTEDDNELHISSWPCD